MFESRDVLNRERHSKITAYRREVWRKLELTPFPHQAEWILAGEGYTLLPTAPVDNQLSERVRLHDGTIEARAIVPREGGAAHVLVDLAAFKAGKSYAGAMFLTGYAGVQGGAVDLIGLEYDTSEPEFNYLCDMLLSEGGMNLKTTSKRNNKKDGDMWFTLENGAHFEVKSYRASRRSDTFKGKTRDVYYFSEAYQLPGLHVYSQISQNLRQRDGHAVFTTTPDRAWVTELHEKGHGRDVYWHCTCGIDSTCNPFTFDQAARDRDDPDKGGLMTRERFDIAWRGQVKRHIGQVYDYEKDGCMFSPLNFPTLWTPEAISFTAEAIQ